MHNFGLFLLHLVFYILHSYLVQYLAIRRASQHAYHLLWLDRSLLAVVVLTLALGIMQSAVAVLLCEDRGRKQFVVIQNAMVQIRYR